MANSTKWSRIWSSCVAALLPTLAVALLAVIVFNPVATIWLLSVFQLLLRLVFGSSPLD
jgi:hypothetical protein